jgi:Prealbumin-like fold domain
MPAHRTTNQSKRLTGAGLIAVTAATLLMMVWAIFPSPAVAILPGVAGNCPPGGTELPGASGSQVVNGVTISWGGQSVTISGGTATLCVKAGNVNSGILTLQPGTHLIVEWAAGNDPNEAGPPFPGISHIQVYETTTTTPPPAKGRIEIEKQTLPNGDPATFGFTGEITATLGDGQSDGKDVEAGTYTVSETALAGWTLTSIVCNDNNSSGTGNTATFNVAAGETVRCVFTNTKNATTTTSGGGGGGGPTTTPPPAPTTTTTTPPTVAPTTIHKSTTTPDEVLPTTVRPGGTAFTGVENVVPIGAIALMLMTSGSGLLWAGSRRRRHDGSQDED